MVGIVNAVIDSLTDGTQEIKLCYGSVPNPSPTYPDHIEVVPTAEDVDIHYHINNYCLGGHNQAKFFATSPVTGEVELKYLWEHCHLWFQAAGEALYVVDIATTRFID